MKRVLADHNVPGPLVRILKEFEIKRAAAYGWAQIKNGKLLRLAEEDGFDVLLTGDQTIKYEQSMAGRKIAVVAMSDNHWNIVQNYVPVIVDAIEQVDTGQVRNVFCGKFVPRKFRRK